MEPWKQKIRELQEEFIDIHVNHVYREKNYEVDRLSKQALNLSPSLLHTS